MHAMLTNNMQFTGVQLIPYHPAIAPYQIDGRTVLVT
jgi:hypothetical protein